MRLHFFFLLFLILLPLASADINRKIEVSDVYFNSSGGYVLTDKEYQIILNPTPYDNFNNPGYYVTEYLPRGFTFKNTNADWYEIDDNKLTMLRLLPPNNNYSLIYKLQYKKDFDPIPSFYGTYLDENRNYGIINGGTSTILSTTTIVRDSIPEVSYEKRAEQPAQIIVPAKASEFIPIPASQVQVVSYTPQEGSGFVILAVLVVIGIVIYIGTRPIYHKTFNIKILSNGDIIIDKTPIGITKEIKFDLITRLPLLIKITGDLSKIVTSIQEIPCDNRCYVITISPDSREHTGMIIFTKKNIKNMKYKTKKL